MRDSGLLKRNALGAALVLGLVTQELLRVDWRPGLNLLLVAVVGVALLAWLTRMRFEPASRESAALVGGALVCGVFIALRDAEALLAIDLLAAFLLIVLAAGQGGAAWLRETGVAGVIQSVVRTGLTVVAGPFGWHGVPGTVTAPAAARRPMVAAAQGLALALPLVLVLGGLLMSADAVFAQVVNETFQLDLEPVLTRVLAAGALAWVAAGFMRALLVRQPLVPLSLDVTGPRMSVTPVAIALWTVNLLFIVFLVIQVRYLFGGAGMVEVTPGLSYAEYARRGFFELVMVAALVVPVLLLAHWAVAPKDGKEERTLRATSFLQVVLLFAIMASALYRMRLYQAAYGLTELRLYTTVFMTWIAFLLVWLSMTVVRGRPRGFVFGGVVAGLVCAAGLNLVSPDALIARTNVSRAADGLSFDAVHAGSLSADAVPALLRGLPQLP